MLFLLLSARFTTTLNYVGPIKYIQSRWCDTNFVERSDDDKSWTAFLHFGKTEMTSVRTTLNNISKLIVEFATIVAFLTVFLSLEAIQRRFSCQT